ncbi:MAG: TolC family protein [Bacteroides sp.]|nr:TolC family protein [Bacteroides sp.]
MKKNITLFLLLLTTSVVAQETDLQKSYRNAALDYNQDVRAAQRNINIGKEQEQSARVDYKPKLSAGANFNYTGNPMELSIGLPGMEAPVSFQGRDLAYGASLSLVQPIYTGGRITETVRMAEHQTSLASNQMEAVKADIAYTADARYWNTVASAEVTNITRRFRQSVAQLTEVIRERVEVQLINRNDLLMAEVKLNEADYQLMKAQNQYEVARMAMNSFAGAPLDEQLPTDSIVPAIYTPESLPVPDSEWVANRPELRMAQDRIAIQESALKLNDARFKPQFFVGVDGSYSSPGYNFNKDLDPNYAVYAKVSVPLWEWGKRRSEKRASNFRVDIARDNYSKVNDAVGLEVQSSYYNYTQAVERVTLTENSLTKARENEQLALERYQEGKISITEVLDAQIYHQTAQINAVQSRLNAQVSYSEYVRALGITKF